MICGCGKSPCTTPGEAINTTPPMPEGGVYIAFAAMCADNQPSSKSAWRLSRYEIASRGMMAANLLNLHLGRGMHPLGGESKNELVIERLSDRAIGRFAFCVLLSAYCLLLTAYLGASRRLPSDPSPVPPSGTPSPHGSVCDNWGLRGLYNAEGGGPR